MLGDLAARVESLADHPDAELPAEGDRSYNENALRKADAVHAALGLPSLGDDSGLEVDALDGEPGIRSARFAGPDAGDAENNRALLHRLRGVPPERRTARFRCALALVRTGAAPVQVEGVCEGRILMAPQGRAGFGYDPLFLPEGESRSFAELPPDVKNTISHRARAVAALLASLRASIAPPGGAS